MNALSRVPAVLAGQLPDRGPVWRHNVLLAARDAGVALQQSLGNPEAAARAHLRAVEQYGGDCVMIDLDTTRLAEALGAPRGTETATIGGFSPRREPNSTRLISNG